MSYVLQLEQLFKERLIFPSSVIVVPERNLGEIQAYAKRGDFGLRAEMSSLVNRRNICFFYRGVPLLASKWLLGAKPRLLNLKDVQAYDTPRWGLGHIEFDYLLALRLAALAEARLYRFETANGIIGIELYKTFAVFEPPVMRHLPQDDARFAKPHIAYSETSQNFSRQRIGCATSFTSPLRITIDFKDLEATFLRSVAASIVRNMDDELAKMTGRATRFANRYVGRLYELYRNAAEMKSDEMLFLIPERYRASVAQDETARRWGQTNFFLINVLFEQRVEEIVLIKKDDYVKVYQSEQSYENND